MTVTGNVSDEWLEGTLHYKARNAHQAPYIHSRLAPQTGIFPASFVEPIGESAPHPAPVHKVKAQVPAGMEDSPHAFATTEVSINTDVVKSLFTDVAQFQATQSDELSFDVDDVIFLKSKVDDQWWVNSDVMCTG